MIRILVTISLAAPLCAQTAFWATRHAGLPTGWTNYHYEPGDIDGDGDLDLVRANADQPINLLRNDGNGRFTDATAGRLTSPPILDNYSNRFADIDGDGDLDLLVANRNGVPNYVFTNDGTGTFTDVSATNLPPNAFQTVGHVVADFTGDGAPEWVTFDLNGPHYYLNDGTGVFTDATATHLVGVSIITPTPVDAPPAVDLDGDGDLDAVIPGANGLLENQGGVLTPFSTQLPSTGLFATWLVDVDGDNDIDLLSIYGSRLLLNDGSATFTEVTGTAFPTQPGFARAVFDVDRDGDVDLYTNSGLWLNDGNGTFQLQSTGVVPLASNAYLHAARDYDGDGDLDLPVVSNLLHHVMAPAPPTIGSTYSVELHTRPGVPSVAAVFAALGTGTTPLGPFGTLRLDPATIVPVGWTLGGSSLTTLTWPIPNMPNLIGTELHYQAIVDDQLAGVVVTNTFGDAVQ